MTLPTRINRGRRVTPRSASARADNRDCCNLDGYGEWQSVGTERHTRVLTCVAKNLDDEIGSAVDDLWLVAEVVRREHEPGELHHLLYIVEPGGRLHLRKQVEGTRPRRILRLLHRHLVWAAACEPLSCLR